MSLSVWSFPTRVVFGVGAVKSVGEEAKRAGGTRALVVTDRGVRGAGLCDPVLASLSEAGIAADVFDDVIGNPVERNVHDGVRAFKEAKADILVAVGGGSPMDVGRLVRLAIHHVRPLVDYDDSTGGNRFITPNVPPYITLPTTAGTGSEVGRSGVVTLDVNKRKTVIFSPHLLANAAILDPELTRSMPPNVTAATGYDALTHCLEALASRGNHPMADGIAVEGLRLIGKYLARAVHAGDNLEARGAMMKAAMMGAVAFQKGLGACHSLAHPLSSECGLHHGLANALCLPAVVDWNGEIASDALSRASVALGGEASGTGCATRLRAIRAEIGLPSGLREAGVTDDKLPTLADLAFVDACHTCNPRTCTRDDLLALYRSSL